MEDTKSKRGIGLVVRALFFAFGTAVASAGFVVACVLYRDHNGYAFATVWLTIVAIALMVAIGLVWMWVAIKGDRRAVT